MLLDLQAVLHTQAHLPVAELEPEPEPAEMSAQPEVVVSNTQRTNRTHIIHSTIQCSEEDMEEEVTPCLISMHYSNNT